MVLALAVAWAVGALAAVEAPAQTNGSSGGFFSGLFGQPSKPTPPPSDPAQDSGDPLRVDNQKKPGVELYVAVAQLYITTGKFAEAEDQFRQAMKIGPDDIRVLLGYAMLKDQMNQPDDATKLYLQAEKKHPKEPAVYNNIAVHFIRYNMLPQAIEAARHAVDLRPMEPRYRNNLAALLVEAGQFREAFGQLRAVYDEPVAHYDLGFLLNKRGLKPAALQEFSIALQMNSRMMLARQWVERLAQERDEHAPPTAMSMPPLQPPPQMAAPMYQRDYGPPAMAAPLPPQYPAPPPQYRIAGPAPVQGQYVPPPQNSGPQYQAQPNNVPLTASRDPDAPRLVPAEPDAGDLRRLPPVSAPSRDAPDGDQVAPNPPDMRR
jgi:hypothetical protein